MRTGNARRCSLIGAVICFFSVCVLGCGGDSKPVRQSSRPAAKKRSTGTTPARKTTVNGDPRKSRPAGTPTGSSTDGSPSTQPATTPNADQSTDGNTGSIPVSPGGLGAAPKEQEESPPPPARAAQPPLSAADANALGLRRIDGRHIVLYTDLPSSAAVDELPKAFDLAVPMWCEYFGVSYDRAKNWRLIGSLMNDKQRFLRAKLLPTRMPPFLNGFQVGDELWLYEQPTPYYRRHLLLHEGVHGFMNWRYNGCGPPWYMEGMAELLATHHWEGGKLQIRYSPKSKEEAPHWGRVRIIKDDFEAGRGLPLRDVLAYGPQAHLKVEPYGWSWAATNFLDNHPAYQKAFRSMPKHAHDNGPFFNEQIMHELGRKTEPQLNIEWQVYVANLEYGYDVARASIDFRPSKTLPAAGATVEVKADRGWQTSGFRIEQGKTYRLTATGEFQIARDTEPWIAEADGVTIRYYRRRPLGRLLAAVEDWSVSSSKPTSLIDPVSVGRSLEWTAERSGDLFLQLNDSPAERDDNAGALQVKVELVD